MKVSQVIQEYKDGKRDFQRLNLREANFSGKDLSGINFKEATLIGKNFTGAKAGHYE